MSLWYNYRGKVKEPDGPRIVVTLSFCKLDLCVSGKTNVIKMIQLIRTISQAEQINQKLNRCNHKVGGKLFYVVYCQTIGQLSPHHPTVNHYNFVIHRQLRKLILGMQLYFNQT
jgi:hypothetical protein